MVGDIWMKMKIGALDTMWFNLPFEERLNRIAELGFKGVQFWLTTAELGFKNPWGCFPKEWLEKRKFEKRTLDLPKAKVAELVAAAGLEITAMGEHSIAGDPRAPGNPSDFDVGDKRKERDNDLKALMTYASEIGVKIVIAESGGDPDKPEHFDKLVQILKELTAHAEDVGVKLALENSPQFYAKDAETLLKLIHAVDSKALGVNYDPANLALTPPGNHDIAGFIRKLGRDRIFHMHAKDAVYGGSAWGSTPYGVWIQPPIKWGRTPWPDVLKAVKDIGYDGWMIVEYVWTDPWEDGIIESKKNLEAMLAKI